MQDDSLGKIGTYDLCNLWTTYKKTQRNGVGGVVLGIKVVPILHTHISLYLQEYREAAGLAVPVTWQIHLTQSTG